MDDYSHSKHDAPASAAAKIEDTSVSVPGTNGPSSIGGLDPGERSPYSGASTPEQDLEDHDIDLDHVRGLGHDQPSGNPQQQKRKGGRKPIYATSEERKQRNRQAQAAFRERRTEYIKQLESTIKMHEDALHNLQASHRTAADDCLMLRYKNSLLERILVEKGIDVQAELRAKTGSPNLGPSRVPQGNPAAPGSQPVGRFPISKFNPNRRSLTGINGKADGVAQLQDVTMLHNRSPLSQPTSASHVSSPNTSIARSPNFIPQGGGAISPSFGPLAQQGQQPLRPQQQPLRPQFNPPARPGLITQQPLSSAVSSASAGSSASLLTNSSATGREAPSYYPSPFQNHYDQLEQEYDAQVDMLDEQDPSDNAAGAVPPFPTSSFAAPPIPPSGIPTGPMGPNPNTTQGALQSQPETGANGPFGGAVPNNIFDPYDPMLDADPFGLSASMHFPTQFSFDAQR